MFKGKFPVATSQNSLGQSVTDLQIGMTLLAFSNLQTVISLNGSRSSSLDCLRFSLLLNLCLSCMCCFYFINNH